MQGAPPSVKIAEGLGLTTTGTVEGVALIASEVAAAASEVRDIYMSLGCGMRAYGRVLRGDTFGIHP